MKKSLYLLAALAISFFPAAAFAAEDSAKGLPAAGEEKAEMTTSEN